MRLLDLSFIRFVLVGISNTAVGFGVIFLCLRVLSLGDVASNAIGYFIGFVWSFALNRMWTFRHRGAAARSFARFAAVCAVAYVVNLLVLLAVRRYFEPASLMPQALAMAAYTVTGYLGSRFFAFPVQRAAARDALS